VSITDLTSIQFADIFGTGLQSLIWSYSYNDQLKGNYKVLDFCGGVKPYLLIAFIYSICVVIDSEKIFD